MIDFKEFIKLRTFYIEKREYILKIKDMNYFQKN